MALIVQKYGASWLRGVGRLRLAADRVAAARAAGHEVVVVVPAARTRTSRPAAQPAPHPSSAPPSEAGTPPGSDRLPLARAIEERGLAARPLPGPPDTGRATTPPYGPAPDADALAHRVRQALDLGAVAVVRCPHGPDRLTAAADRDDADTTAVALAVAIKADVCEFRTAVDGAHTADPRIAPDARLLPRLTYEHLRDLSACGTPLLTVRSVELAWRHGLPLHVRAAAHEGPGTLVGEEERRTAEQPSLVGVAHRRAGREVTMTTGHAPGPFTAQVLRIATALGATADVLTRDVAPARTRLTLLLPESRCRAVLAALERARGRLDVRDLACGPRTGRVSLVGSGLQQRPGTAAFCSALAAAGIRFDAVTASDAYLTAVCRAGQIDDAVRAVHAFCRLGTGGAGGAPGA